jgi:hypothetical protein
MKAIFPGQCVICHGDFVRGEPIADSGQRGTRGGKKMAHAGCVGARGNPWPRKGGMAIPGDYPDSDYAVGPDPQLANWTSYPEYSYESFYRTNPAAQARRNFLGFGGKKAAPKQVEESPEITQLRASRKQLKAQLAGAEPRSDLWFTLLGDLNTVERRLERLLSGARLNPSAAASRPVYEQMPDNAGPYLPQMFPYGQGGRPASYEPKAKKNPFFRDAWAPSGKVWEHRRWHLAAHEQRSVAPEVFYWSNLEDAFQTDDPQEQEDAAGLSFQRTPQGGWRWSHDDGMGGTYRHEAQLVANRTRSRFNPGGKGQARTNRGKRSAFLKPSAQSWPVGDRKHALIALQYMTRGLGKASEYPELVTALAARYPAENSANREIWTFYRKHREHIEVKAGRSMPTMRELRAQVLR